MQIEILSNAFRIESRNNKYTNQFFLQIASIRRYGNKILISGTQGPQNRMIVDFDDLSLYDGATPTSIDDVIEDMRTYIGASGGIAASVDVTHLGGSPIATDQGNSTIGTLRVAIADDDTLLTQILAALGGGASAPATIQALSNVGVADGVYITAGSQIDMSGYNTLTLYCRIVINDSTGVHMRIMSRQVTGGTNYGMSEDSQYIEEFTDENQYTKVVFSTDGGTPYISLQTMAEDVDTGGGTIAQIEIIAIKSNS